MPVETQFQRRVKYGLNVLVATLAAVAVTVLINWISYRNFSTGLVRWDLTSTRQYSLSPLTRKVLDRLDSDFRMVTLLDPSESAREDTQLARDLVEEYARASGRIKVEHLNPATDLARREQFERSLHAMFAEKFKPLESHIAAGLQQLTQLKKDMGDQLAILREALLDPSLSPPARPDEAVSDTIKRLKVSELVIQAQIETIDKRIPQLAGYQSQPMPNYGGTWNDIRVIIDGTVNQLFTTMLNDPIKKALEDPTVSDRAKDLLLKLKDRIVRASQATRDAIIKLGPAQSVPAYDAALSRMAGANPVVIVGKSDISVLNLSDMFRAPTQGGDSPEGQSESRSKEQLQDKQFLGEERLTGVLARMTLSQFQAQPMVVLVGVGATATSQPAFYSQIKERLESMNYQVQVWQPAQSSPFEPPSAKERDKPAPVVAPGQRAVWILLPGDPPDALDDARKRTLEATYRHVRSRMERGDGVLAIVPPEIDSAAVQKQLLGEWGMEVKDQYVIMQEVVDAYGRSRSMPYHIVQQWPAHSPISKAIGEAGMAAQFIWSAPIKIKQAPAGVEHLPIIEIRGKNLWANLNTVKETQEKKPAVLDEGDERDDRFVIGYAARRPGLQQGDPQQRLVVISDGAFASDYFGSRKEVDPRTNRAVQFTQFPGNHELLVNSVYWLSGMDELIAVSARNQEVRRIAAMSPGQVSALSTTMMAGMPLGIFVIGLAVWWSRRG